eukprot:333561-Prorocentrum_minimum.AAC.1
MGLAEEAEKMPLGVFTPIKPMPVPGRYYLTVALMVNARTLALSTAKIAANVTMLPTVDTC